MQSDSIPDYIERRIRQPVPRNSQIVAGSSPVVAFGDARRAEVATLGLNPSKLEFLDQSGAELRAADRRLATYTSLGTSDLGNASLSVIAQVLSDCASYFQRNPYRRWFDQLEPILQRFNASYYDGSACHLDIVQWATDPTWSGLPKETRNGLMETDVRFLLEQLKNENIRLLLLNGAGVINEFQTRTNIDLIEVDRVNDLGRNKTKLSTGTMLGRIKIVGWSTNIQSSFGVTRELRREIARRVASLASQN